MSIKTANGQQTKSQQTPAQILARLKQLAGEAGERAYERVRLAAALLKDKAWLGEPQFEGDEWKAREHLEQDFFGDLCGSVPLARLLAIYEQFPNVEDWRSARFNLMAMSAMLKKKEGEEREGHGPRRATLKELEEAQDKAKHFEFMYKQSRDDGQSKDKRIAELEAGMAKLRDENAELRGRVKQLEELLEKRAARAA